MLGPRSFSAIPVSASQYTPIILEVPKVSLSFKHSPSLEEQRRELNPFNTSCKLELPQGRIGLKPTGMSLKFLPPDGLVSHLWFGLRQVSSPF